MLSRQYTKKIQLLRTEGVADGYGGYIPSIFLMGDFWAEVKQLSSNRENVRGASEMKLTYSFKIRSIADISQYNIDNLSIIYKGKEFIVNDITYDDENFRFVNITANG